MKMRGFIIGLAPGEREYTINGVKYVVGAKFRARTILQTE